MATKDNLIKFTKETAKEKGRKGGLTSGKVRRRKKEMKQAMDLLLSLPVSSKNKKRLESLGLEDSDINNQMLLLATALDRAIAGDVRAMNFIKEITASTPISKTDKAKLRLEKEKIDILGTAETSEGSVTIINDAPKND